MLIAVISFNDFSSGHGGIWVNHVLELYLAYSATIAHGPEAVLWLRHFDYTKQYRVKLYYETSDETAVQCTEHSHPT